MTGVFSEYAIDNEGQVTVGFCYQAIGATKGEHAIIGLMGQAPQTAQMMPNGVKFARSFEIQVKLSRVGLPPCLG